MSTKKEEIFNIIQEEDPDILGITEILYKIDPSLTKSDFNIDNYDSFYEDDPFKGER